MKKTDMLKAMDDISTIHMGEMMKLDMIKIATIIAENGEISNKELCKKMDTGTVQTYIRALEGARMIRVEVREEESIHIKVPNPVPEYISKYVEIRPNDFRPNDWGWKFYPNPDFTGAEEVTKEIKVRRKYYVWLG